MEKLKVYADVARLQDLAELGPSEMMTEVGLGWREGPSIEEILPTLRRWRHLRRLTLRIWNSSITRSEMLRFHTRTETIVIF